MNVTEKQQTTDVTQQTGQPTVTLAEMKKCFERLTLVDFGPVYSCRYMRCPLSGEETNDCERCNEPSKYETRVRIDAVHGVRFTKGAKLSPDFLGSFNTLLKQWWGELDENQYLLDCYDLDLTFVVSKPAKSLFDIGQTPLSTQLKKQFLDMSEGSYYLGREDYSGAKWMYCRFWEGNFKNSPADYHMIRPCKREKARNLALFVKRNGPPREHFAADVREATGAVYYNHTKAELVQGTEREYGGGGVNCWVFRYDPERDAIIESADAVEKDLWSYLFERVDEEVPYSL